MARPGVSMKALIEASERDLEVFGINRVDAAGDAALTLTGLNIASEDTAEDLGKRFLSRVIAVR